MIDNSKTHKFYSVPILIKETNNSGEWNVFSVFVSAPSITTASNLALSIAKKDHQIDDGHVSLFDKPTEITVSDIKPPDFMTYKRAKHCDVVVIKSNNDLIFGKLFCVFKDNVEIIVENKAIDIKKKSIIGLLHSWKEIS